MNDERMQSLLDTWYRDREVPRPDVRTGVARVMADMPQTRQRRRWWPFPLLRRRAQTPTATPTDTAEYQPSPIPASNGQTPTAIGRTRSMLSPVKAITAGALVFAIGGVMLIAQPFQQQSSVPGAETDDVAATWVTGNVQPASSCSSGDSESDGDVRRSRNVECRPQTWTSSDPRLTGQVSRRWNDDIYQTEEGTISVSMDAAYLRNDDGGWACTDSRLLEGSGRGSKAVAGGNFTCVGDGGYEGLSAILVLEETGGFTEDIVGLIFSGDFPPVPEPPAIE